MRATFIVVSLLLAALPARAHERSVSHARVGVSGGSARIELRISSLDRNALGMSDAALAPHLTSALRLGGCRPEPASFRELGDTTGWSRFEWRAQCPSPPRTLRAIPIPSRPSHVCFVRIVVDGKARDLVLSELAPEASFDVDDTTPSFVRFVPIGIAHILSGLDHLAFLLLLLLAARSLREAGVMVTGFTLGHSATLAAAALGAISPDARLVEAMIGLSIAIVAVENVWRSQAARSALMPLATAGAIGLAAALTRSPALAGLGLFTACYFALVARARDGASLRCAVAALFGLLHGLGFAGALSDTDFPREAAIPALVGFNAGVELGQLAIAALAWPLLAWLRARPRADALVLELGSAAGLSAGVFWFLTRL